MREEVCLGVDRLEGDAAGEPATIYAMLRGSFPLFFKHPSA